MEDVMGTGRWEQMPWMWVALLWDGDGGRTTGRAPCTRTGERGAAGARRVEEGVLIGRGTGKGLAEGCSQLQPEQVHRF